MKPEFSNKVKDLNGSAIREMFKMAAFPDLISFAGGAPARELYPREELAGIAADILREQGNVALGYGVTEGYVPLIEQLKERMGKQGIYRDGEDEILITAGGQQALALIAKAFLNEGDTIAVENPSFLGALNAFRSNGAKLAGVPMEEDGIKIEDIPSGCKMVYVIPNFQNPSGITMSLEKRKKVLEQDTFILEDDPYGELRFAGEPITSIKKMDDTGKVIYISSFSKIMSPGLRVGFIVARKDIIEKLTVVKQAEDVHTVVISQMIVSEYMKRYDIDAHIEKAAALYKQKHDVMQAEIDKHFPSHVKAVKAKGGLFIWVDGVPFELSIVKKAMDAGVLVIAGKGFMANGEEVDAFRLNFSLPTLEQIEEGIKILGGLLN
jgi:2-aminoadipate transaminase